MNDLSLEMIRKFWPNDDPEDILDQWNNMKYQLRKEAEARQKRKNVITWSDVKVLTKHLIQIQAELTDYAARGYDNPSLYGDANVFVALITLQTKIDQLLKRHDDANGRLPKS